MNDQDRRAFLKQYGGFLWFCGAIVLFGLIACAIMASCMR